MSDDLRSALERLLIGLGYELVQLEKGGGRRRPLLRLRVDRPGDPPGRSSLTAGDCGRISAAVAEFLEDREEGAGNYVLEVSSPGIERPLTRTSDYSRFAGAPVRVSGYGPIVGRKKQVDAVLLGLGDDAETVLLDVKGERIAVPVTAIARAHLRYSFDGQRAEGDTRERGHT